MLVRLLVISVCLLSPSFAIAQTVPEIASQAAARISSLLPPRATVSFDFQNLSALSPAEFSGFRSALEAEAKKIGIEIRATTQPESQVRVAVSQNQHGTLIVVDMLSGERRQTFFLPWTLTRPAAPGPRMRLEQKAVWEQPEPILDFVLLNSGSGLLVLGVGKLSLYQIADGKWKLSGAIPLQLFRPLPRDPRGRLIADHTVFHVYLPATTCSGSAEPPLGASCVPGNDAWSSLRWVSDRNYIEMPGTQTAFYTAAPLDNGARLILAALDGHVHDQSSEFVNGAADWGSDLAGPIIACGSNSLVLATQAGDRDANDSVEAHEIVNGSALSASNSMPLAGPVTAMWPSEDPAQVSVVVRNSRTGEYEASRLRLACAE